MLQWLVCSLIEDLFEFDIVKVDKDEFIFQEDAVMENMSLEDLADELPDHQPRYVILSYEYKHDDGRVSYPLIFFYWSPISRFHKFIFFNHHSG